MNIEALKILLQDYHTDQQDEQEMLERIKALVADCPERCCDREFYTPGHITASAWIVTADMTQCLMLHHAKLNIWLQPGGHVEQDADIQSAAAREVMEETGLSGIVPQQAIFDVDIHLIPARKEAPDHFHFDVRFLFIVPDAGAIVCSDESNDLRWIALDDVATYSAHRSIERMVTKTKKLREHLSLFV